MALFMIFYKAKHTQLGGQRTDMPNYIYRLQCIHIFLSVLPVTMRQPGPRPQGRPEGRDRGGGHADGQARPRLPRRG